VKVVAPIATAVHAARRARVGVVFASDWNSEGYDRPTLALPGAADALISAVAAANRRTIVVLNTGGPVLMPWLSKVAAVLEAWYPGEQDGAATLAVLTGQVDPSGRLPVTFPLTDVQSPGGDPSSWPGVKSDVSFRSGLDIGYRYYDARGLRPLFPFGYGLSYTTFRLGSTTVRRAGSADAVGVSVTNTGRRGGVEVVEAYLGFRRQRASRLASSRPSRASRWAPDRRDTSSSTCHGALSRATSKAGGAPSPAPTPFRSGAPLEIFPSGST